MIKNVSTASLKVLQKTLKMGVMLNVTDGMAVEVMKADIDFLDQEIKKREKGDC